MIKNKVIDLRSDTVTMPTKEMLVAINNAQIGDDFYGDDAAVKELEELSAHLLGKEAGLFVTSGTMGNLVSIMSHTNRGESVLLEKDSHIFRCESGNISAIAGLLPKCIIGKNGFFGIEDIAENISDNRILSSKTTLLCIENPHNAAGGTILKKKLFNSLCLAAHQNGLKIHIDGARIFNAAICSQTEASDLVKEADSITFCLSKDLGCPYGSIVVGTKDFIAKARKNRQMLGGGLRQGGLMAAAGIYALKNNINRLIDDHKNAILLAEGLLNLGFNLDLENVQTNMVYANTPPHIQNDLFCSKLLEKNIKVNAPANGKKIRFVTHLGIEKKDIEIVLNVVFEILGIN